MSDRSILFRVLVLCAVMQVVKGKHKFKADLSGAALSREAPRPHTRTVDLLDGSL